MEAATLRAALAGDYVGRYPDEVAALLEERDTRDVGGILEQLPPDVAAAVFRSSTPAAAADLLAGLSEGQASDVLRALDPAQAALVCSRLAEEDRLRLLSRLPRAEARELRELMAYPADSAAGPMTARVPTFRLHTAASQVLARLRSAHVEGLHDVALVDAGGRFVGMVPVERLATTDPEVAALQLASGERSAVQAMTRREDVVELMTRRRTGTLPIVDVESRLLGVVRHEDVLSAVEEEASGDLQTMVGASQDEHTLSPVGFAVRKRLPWLQVNLLTAFLAAAVVGLFEDTIARVTSLAVLLPVVAGESGNRGAQALAVTIRGLALREVRLRHWRRVAFKEGAVGLINGLGVAVTTSIGVYLWSGSPGLTMVIATSMVLSMLIAGLAGAIVPMALVAARQDPAQSSSIVLTTVTDIVGFFSFLGIATLLTASL